MSVNCVRLVVLAAALAAGGLRAEEARFSVERFRPAIDGRGLLDVDSAALGESFEVSAGAFLGYALNPLVLRQGGERVGALVAHRVGGDLAASLSLFDWVELGVDVPLMVFQARDTAEARQAVLDAVDLSAIGVGDLRVLAKIRLLRAPDQIVDLALIPALTVPTGFPAGDSGSYLGEGQVTFAPEIAVSRAYRNSGWRWAANLGYRLRPEERKVVNVTIGHELTYRAGVGYRFDDVPVQLDVSANGGTFAFQPFVSGFEENPLEVLAGVSYDVLPVVRITGGLGKGILSGFGTPDFRAFVGLRFVPFDDDRDKDGIKNADDVCPDVPEDKDAFDDADGCPDPDNDHDGILDVDDHCPLVPEDDDDFQDLDGCPDPDNDGDGVLDVDDACPLEPGPADTKGCPLPDRDHDGVLDRVDECPDVPGLVELQGCPDRDKDGLRDSHDRCPDQPGPLADRGCPDTDGDGIVDPDDKCPSEPETKNGIDDDDGCPERQRTLVNVTKSKIEILDKVYFDVGKDVIQDRSFPLLDQVAKVLQGNAELAHVRVEGHTDSDGTDASNLDLSKRRAEAVKRYLEGRGIAAERLEAVGYGETRPVVQGYSKAIKEQNRRVEFVIVETGKASSAVEGQGK